MVMCEQLKVEKMKNPKNPDLAARFYGECESHTETFGELDKDVLALIAYMFGAILNDDGYIYIDTANPGHSEFLTLIQGFECWEELKTHIQFAPESEPDMDQDPLYVCYWSESYSGPDVCLKGRTHFRKDMGYSMSNLMVISALKVGESYANHDHGLYSHVVTRVR